MFYDELGHDSRGHSSRRNQDSPDGYLEGAAEDSFYDNIDYKNEGLGVIREASNTNLFFSGVQQSQV